MSRLVADLAGGQPGPALRGLVSGAAGNPLYIQELVGGLAQGMRLRAAREGRRRGFQQRPSRPVPDAGGGDRPAGGFLSERTRELLQVAALLGSAFAVADVAAVLGRPVTDLLGQVTEATDSGVLTALPDRLAFRHPLVRAVLADALPFSARQALHGQIAQALVTRAAPERVAGHLLAAGPAAAPLLPWLADAADDIADRAPATGGGAVQPAAGLRCPAAGRDLQPPACRSGRGPAAHRRARGGRAGGQVGAGQATGCPDRGGAAVDAGQRLREPGRRSTGRLRRSPPHSRPAGSRSASRPGSTAWTPSASITLSQPTATSTSWRDSVAAAQASGDTEALAYGMAAAARSRLWDGWIEEALGYADCRYHRHRGAGAAGGRAARSARVPRRLPGRTGPRRRSGPGVRRHAAAGRARRGDRLPGLAVPVFGAAAVLPGALGRGTGRRPGRPGPARSP